MHAGENGVVHLLVRIRASSVATVFPRPGKNGQDIFTAFECCGLFSSDGRAMGIYWLCLKRFDFELALREVLLR